MLRASDRESTGWHFPETECSPPSPVNWNVSVRIEPRLQRRRVSSDLLVGSDEPRPLCLQVLLQTAGGTAVRGVACQFQLQLPDFLLLTFTLCSLGVDALLHLDQFGLDLPQLCTKLKGRTRTGHSFTFAHGE